MSNDTSWKTRCIHDGEGYRISQIPLAKNTSRITRIMKAPMATPAASHAVHEPSFEEDLKSKITVAATTICLCLVAVIVWVLVVMV